MPLHTACFVGRNMRALACVVCLLTQIDAREIRAADDFVPKPALGPRVEIAAGAVRGNPDLRWDSSSNNSLPLSTDVETDPRPNFVILEPPEDDEDYFFDENILPVQEVAPLAPDGRLRPPAAGTSPEGMESARSMLGPPTLAGLSSGRGRARLLARGRSAAPTMIGDFFGGVPASISQLPGLPFDQVVTMQKQAFFGNFKLVNPAMIAPAGQFYGLPSGKLTSGQSVVVGPNGTLQGISGLVRVNQNGVPLPGAINQPRLIATATGQTIAGLTQQPGSTPQIDPGSSIFAIRPVVNVVFPNPGASGAGLVGIEKITENTSPMPRDRVFFNYSNFGGVPLTGGGVNVNRMTPGFEKTFFDGMTSLEMRLPFATTLSNNVLVDGVTNTGTTQFGDMSLTGKMLLYTDDSLAVSGGLQMALPTASDLTARLTDGTQLVRINNDTVYLMPFLGALYTPGERFFSQGFLQFDAPANANRVFVNNFNPNGNLDPAGKVRDVPFLFADIGSGYWLYRDDEAQGLTGFSTTLELHYNRSLQPTNVVNTALYRIGSVLNNVEMLNVVIGGNLHFNLNSTLTVAYVTPIGNSADQLFNHELRVFFNYRFGPQTFRTRTTL